LTEALEAIYGHIVQYGTLPPSEGRALTGAGTLTSGPDPAWKSLPTWYLVATQDEAIPPDAERMFAQRMGAAVVEVPASHGAMVSRPVEVARLVQTAVEACSGNT
jgi:pimeloyl-ACP methyl ester carboxylesterase